MEFVMLPCTLLGDIEGEIVSFMMSDCYPYFIRRRDYLIFIVKIRD